MRMVCEPILITGPHLVTCVARCRRATGALIGSGGSALGCGCGLRWALSLSHQTAVQTSAAPCAGGRAGSRDAGLAAASRSCSLLRPPRIPAVCTPSGNDKRGMDRPGSCSRPKSTPKALEEATCCDIVHLCLGDVIVDDLASHLGVWLLQPQPPARPPAMAGRLVAPPLALRVPILHHLFDGDLGWVVPRPLPP